MRANPIRRSLHLLIAFALVLSQLMMLAPSTALALPEVTVNSTADGGDVNPGDRICSTGATLPSGAVECTFRAAIEEGNASNQVREIHFAIPAGDANYNGGRPLIRPTSVLPPITRRLSIDGTTQTPSSGTPPVILDGSLAGGGDRDGLLIQANGSVVRGLVVRNFADDGIEIHSNNVIIVGNHISGNDDGVLVEDGRGAIIGTNSASDRNVIHANRKHGVSLDTANNSSVAGNYIGLDASGSPSSNGGQGIDVWDGTRNVTISSNVISANNANGVAVREDTRAVSISANLVGVNAGASSAAGNGANGIAVSDASQNISVGPSNVISGNGGNGIASDETVSRLTIRGNLIGTDSSGTGAIPNGGHGVLYGSASNRDDIGGPNASDRNIIAHNGGHGVAVRNQANLEVAIVGNSIYGNQGLGIDLPQSPSFNVNDPGDGDAGPNGGLNYPTILSAEETAGTVYVDGELDVPNGYYLIEFFTNPSGADGSGYGEGEQVATSHVVRVTNTSRSFFHTFTGSDGEVLTATATRCNSTCANFHHTSEFSPAHTITIGNHPPVLDPIASMTVGEETQATFAANASDADGDQLEFSLTSAPAGATIDPDTGIFVWTPTESQGPGTYQFDVVVVDDGAPVTQSATTPVTITVGEVNQPPVLADPGDFTISEGSQLVFTATATDHDEPANPLAFGLGGTAPLGADIEPDTGVFTWTPAEDQGPGVFTFELIVDDGTASDTVSVTIDVEEVNQPPAIVAPGDQSTAEGTTVSLSIQGSDPDLPVNQLHYTASGLPPGLSINPTTGVIAGTIQFHAAVGSPHTVSVAVTDDAGLSTSTTFLWVTDNTNRPPTIGAIPSFELDEHQSLGFDVGATDPDPGTQLRFSLVGAPAGVLIDPITGILTWTPGEAHGPFLHTFTVVVSDSGSPVTLTASRTVRVKVNEVNRPPILTNPGHHSVAEGTAFSTTVVASDPDLPANRLTYRLGNGAPPGVSINPVTGVLTWTPSESQGPATYNFDIVVDDGLRTDREPISIAVAEVNTAPSLTNPGAQSDHEASVVRLVVNASDVDLPANSLRFRSTGLPPGLTIDPLTGVITGVIDHSAASGSPYDVSVTVSDNAGATATTHFSWETPNTNRAPTIAAASNRTVAELTNLAFNANASDPDPGNHLRYHLVGSPNGMTIDSTTGQVSWTPTEAQGPGRYTFDIDVTDDDVASLTSTQTVTVTVTEDNTRPEALNDLASTREDNPVTIAVLNNDSDIDYPANRLFVSSVEQPQSGGFASVSGSSIVFQPGLDFNGSTRFAYTVSDGVDTSQASVTVEVAPVNDAPVAGDDHFRLVTYQTAQLDVLGNDFDADQDRLGLSLVTLPDSGKAWIDGTTIAYDPVNGWTGAVEFEYRATDGSGASATATVQIIVGNEVLIGARTLATDLGVEVVPFDPPAPTFDAETLSLIDLGGITLLADSFFQTVDALRVPLGFLGVTVAMVVGFGATSEVPALVFGARRRHWSIVRLGRHQRLPAYSEPGGRKVVYNFDPTAAGIVSNGRSRQIGGQTWVPIETPNGPGWIQRNYLTEQVDIQAFADDPRPVELVHDLAERLREERSIASLVGSQGLVVALTGSPNQIAPEEVAALMGGKRLKHVSGFAKGPNTPHEWSVAVAEPFLEAYDATSEITAETPHSRSALIPTECWNFSYLALGTRSHRQPWLVFFEYRDGKAWIAGLGVDE